MINRLNVFTVTFKTEDLLVDFKDMVSMFNKKELQIEVVEGSNGTSFVVKAVEGKESVWDIVMHKYMSYSKQMRKDATGNRFAPVIFVPFQMLLQNVSVG